MTEEYHSKVQSKDTVKYGDKQHIEHFATIPKKIVEHLGLKKSFFLKWTDNDDGTVTLTKCKSKPTTTKLSYEKWLSKIKPYIPTEPPGKNPFQIYNEAGILETSISAIWVERARRDIRLKKNVDPRTHKTLWYMLPEDNPKPRKLIELKLG